MQTPTCPLVNIFRKTRETVAGIRLKKLFITNFLNIIIK